jgi:1-deoxy-D-xylulose-5-phosphate synthase
MLAFSLQHHGPCGIRYPKSSVKTLAGERAPIELGKSEIFTWGEDGVIFAYGALLPACLEAAELLSRDGLSVGVISARFVKPLDIETIFRAVQNRGFIITVEEAALAGGFGSAVVEAAVDAGLDLRAIRRLGIPERFIEHGERGELLADLGLDASGIAAACRALRNELSSNIPVETRR